MDRENGKGGRSWVFEGVVESRERERWEERLNAQVADEGEVGVCVEGEGGSSASASFRGVLSRGFGEPERAKEKRKGKTCTGKASNAARVQCHPSRLTATATCSVSLCAPGVARPSSTLMCAFSPTFAPSKVLSRSTSGKAIVLFPDPGTLGEALRVS
jgi:hypothetical protein